MTNASITFLPLALLLASCTSLATTPEKSAEKIERVPIQLTAEESRAALAECIAQRQGPEYAPFAASLKAVPKTAGDTIEIGLFAIDAAKMTFTASFANPPHAFFQIAGEFHRDRLTGKLTASITTETRN